MKKITRLLSLALVVCASSLWCTDVWAQGAVQATIAGVVRDTSGAVLPGVTVEASREGKRNGISAGIELDDAVLTGAVGDDRPDLLDQRGARGLDRHAGQNGR